MEKAKFIELNAGVRYWEDALLNGQPDEEGNIPLREGDGWVPIIELETGRVIGWPEKTHAQVHYKVCDQGEYWLLDESRNRIAKWKRYYVPDEILCVGTSGYGDYIIFEIGYDGLIIDWKKPVLNEDEWEQLNQKAEGET